LPSARSLSMRLWARCSIRRVRWLDLTLCLSFVEV
jgi:hypothetical protein